jgi:hypothetical protein
MPARPDPILNATTVAVVFVGFGVRALVELRRHRRRIAAELSELVRAMVCGAVAAVLDQLDLTDLVVERVDLDRIVGQLDLDAIVGRVDFVDIVRRAVIDIDLPEIIRESTASTVSDTVRDVRMRGIAADESVSTWIHRVLRSGRDTAMPATGPVPVAPDER